MQAIRSALNRACGIQRGLPFWKARIQVTLFNVVVGAQQRALRLGVPGAGDVVCGWLPDIRQRLQGDAA